jgi:hypothetical protein
MSKARLDKDKTAKPKTRIVSHVREGARQGAGMLVQPELEDIESGKRIPLVDNQGRPFTPPFAVGDLVMHRASFLRAIGWYTDVPVNGIVKGYGELGPNYPLVLWSDAVDPTSVNAMNIILEGKPDYS